MNGKPLLRALRASTTASPKMATPSATPAASRTPRAANMPVSTPSAAAPQSAPAVAPAPVSTPVQAPVQTPAVQQAPAPAAITVTVDASKATHFLGNITALTRGAEIHLEKEFNLTSDPYLADHAIEGTPYVPGVMGIETFMETATALTGRVPQGLKDVHFYLPIKLLRNRPQAVRVIGKAEGNEAVMEIESDFINSKGIKMGNTRRHFTARSTDSFVSKWESVKAAAMANIYAPVTVSKEEIYQSRVVFSQSRLWAFLMLVKEPKGNIPCRR